MHKRGGKDIYLAVIFNNEDNSRYELMERNKKGSKVIGTLNSIHWKKQSTKREQRSDCMKTLFKV